MALFTYSQLREMKPGEFKVYNHIISHMEDIAEMNIRQLAEAAGVSTTTVLRLCEKAGCEGYTEMKYRVRRELEGQKREVSFDAFPAVQFVRESERDREFLMKLEAAAELCANAGQVILCGDGGCGMLAGYGAYLMNSSGGSAFLAEGGAVDANPVKGTMSVLIVLSASGENDRTLTRINRYKSAGSAVVSITNTRQCPAARMSDVNFPCYMPEAYRGKDGGGEIVSQIPALYILEALAAAVQDRTSCPDSLAGHAGES